MSSSPRQHVDFRPVRDFLPPGKRCAICFTIDDVHPGKSSDAYEAGGDMEKGALGHVEWLLSRHSELKTTLFTAADWRQISPALDRPLLARVPFLRDHVMLARAHPRGTMRLDRHPSFVEYLRGLPRTDVALHGLHHLHPGRRIHVEFQAQSRGECRRMLREAIRIFEDAGLPLAPGMCPPGWNAPPALLEAMSDLGLRFVASAREIRAPIAPDAVSSMSGLPGAPLIYPAWTAGGRLLHFTTNFQATTPIERATAILDAGGLLAIKAHIAKNVAGFITVDGLDMVYSNFLDLLFSSIERRYGSALWWTSFDEITRRVGTQPGHEWRAGETLTRQE